MRVSFSVLGRKRSSAGKRGGQGQRGGDRRAILACFLKDKESKIESAIIECDFARARRQVNGGAHGLGNFQTACQRREKLI